MGLCLIRDFIKASEPVRVASRSTLEGYLPVEQGNSVLPWLPKITYGASVYESPLHSGYCPFCGDNPANDGADRPSAAIHGESYGLYCSFADVR